MVVKGFSGQPIPALQVGLLPVNSLEQGGKVAKSEVIYEGKVFWYCYDCIEQLGPHVLLKV